MPQNRLKSCISAEFPAKHVSIVYMEKKTVSSGKGEETQTRATRFFRLFSSSLLV
jgi:hypothetical protein